MKFARDGKIFAINTRQLPNISIKHLANFGNVSFCTFFQYTNTYCGMNILSLLVESYKFNLSNNICKRTIQPSRKMYRTSHFINEVVVLLLSTYCKNRYFTQIACLFKRWKYISNKKNQVDLTLKCIGKSFQISTSSALWQVNECIWRLSSSIWSKFMHECLLL